MCILTLGLATLERERILGVVFSNLLTLMKSQYGCKTVNFLLSNKILRTRFSRQNQDTVERIVKENFREIFENHIAASLLLKLVKEHKVVTS